MEAIKAAGLTKYYGRTKGIENLNLTVENGEFFGFIGPNGAGKSTTIRTLLGLIAPTSGTARIFGLDIMKDKEKILQKIGYLPSEAVFYSGMKVRDVLKLSANLRKKNCIEEAEILCERLQLDVTRKADEPTGGLDPLMQKEFFDILRERNKEGATVFLSSHILSEIQRNCTRAAIIREGEIIACDSVEVLSRTSAKRVTVQGKINFDMLEGVRDKMDMKDSVSFLYSGDMNRLLHTLATGQVSDFSVTEPDLEEIFLHYYTKDGDIA